MSEYDSRKIEPKWQEVWRSHKLFSARDKGKKYYCLIEFPYPSSDGLHVGHPRSYTAIDIIARKKRMEGYDVLFPIGFDAFGLPTENYAIKMKRKPQDITKENIENFTRQLTSLGFSFDWDRQVTTSDPKYYRWTQWLFLQFYKAGLVYQAEMPINWCPKDKIGLANEEVVDGACERCGTPVTRRNVRQWMFRITKYAQRLIDDLETVDYLDKIKTQQINWIGRSDGAEIDFELHDDAKPDFIILHGYEGSPRNNFIPWLKKEIENSGYAVQVPALPHTGNPTEKEQVEYVLKNCQIGSNTIILGHSLGAVVGMKVLEKVDKKIRGFVTVGAATLESFGGSPRPWWSHFSKDADFEKIRKRTDFRAVLSDTEEEEKEFRVEYQRQLASKLQATLIETVAKEKHFCAPKEPAILDSIIPKIKVFTTRPDTIFGATYMVLAPEHPLVDRVRSSITNWADVEKYRVKAAAKSDLERTELAKEKTGVELKGIKALNPMTKEEIPVWIADYVLISYGTGAIMAVPAHDERDFAFAKKFKLAVRQVIENEKQETLFGIDGKMINSGMYNGLRSQEMKKRVIKDLQSMGIGAAKTQYKLRDWIFSRQHYWGEPIPLIHCEKCGVQPVPEKELPVVLPDVEKYEPTDTGESPLAVISEWVNVKCPNCNGAAKRETDTMPNWAGSSWYFMRYVDAQNDKEFASMKKMKHWLPVDLYNGGSEHTVLHLLYSRFWYKALFDLKLVPTAEPYQRRVSHGLVIGEDGQKMSKSRGNVINPNDIVKEYGADTLRMYLMFMGPYAEPVSWSTNGIFGVKRFLERVWDHFQQPTVTKENTATQTLIHKTIEKVNADIDGLRFNTAVSTLMIMLNAFQKDGSTTADRELFLKILTPFAPHLAEELWQQLGHTTSIHKEAWPKANPKFLQDKTVSLVVQVNGKLRAKIDLPTGTDENNACKQALANDNVKKFISGTPKKVIFVKDKLINFVV